LGGEERTNERRGMEREERKKGKDLPRSFKGNM
jgi:hypothetical protein